MGRPFLPFLALLPWLATAGAAPPSAAEYPAISAVVTRVIDGDGLRVTLQSGPITVRLFGIDAPERGQTGGKAARDALARRVDGRQVWLDVTGQDRYDRLTAVVYLGDEDINGWLIDNGHAWAYRRFLKDPDYCRREHAARRAGRGLWSPDAKDLYAPWEWRNVRPGQWDLITDFRAETAANCIAAMPRDSGPVPASTPDDVPRSLAARCPTKGNVSRSGRIYHLPGSASYERTVIEESRGERWFCSEDEARAAGWRAPRD